jgi:hypothetical protein
MVLEALELAMRGPMTEKVPITKKLTIEHVIPRQWQQHWPLSPWDGQEAIQPKALRERLLHTFGKRGYPS